MEAARQHGGTLDDGGRTPASRAFVRTEPSSTETVLAIRPSPLYIVLRSLGVLAWIIAIAAVMLWLGSVGVIRAGAMPFLLAAAALLGVVLIWRTLDWACRSYALIRGGPGGGRVEASWGVLRRSSVEAPLDAIRSIVIHRLLRERLFGLGSIGFATAATDGVEVAWWMVPDPQKIRTLARAEIERATDPHKREGTARRMPVIGVAGGIGSGKSALAGALAKLGCVVIDSDAEAKAVLQTPAVREQLRAWWGDRVLDEQGQVDRKAVAAIVFTDYEARRRLEGLIHPMIRHSRAEQIEAARNAGAPGAVIDAPLLFEAGVDAECDYIVFVDTPRERRLERVRARGWDEEELDRRERSQWDLERKRAASHDVVKNDGSLADLDAAARRILTRATAHIEPGGTSGG